MTPPFDKQSFRDLTAQELREFYAKARQEYTPEYLQKLFQPEEGIPLESIIAELQADQKQRKVKAG